MTEKTARSLPRVCVLATGGTIAGEARSPTAAAYEPGRLSVGSLLGLVPNLKRLADVRGEQFCQIAGQDMNEELWIKLVRRVNDILLNDEADGVVITHGTDTMEETAYFLNLAVRSDPPVVLTGSMRAATSLGAEGALNLYNAVAVAADAGAAGYGVLVAVNDEIHTARDVMKADTTHIHAFVSPNGGIVGKSNFGENIFVRKPIRRHTIDSPFRVENLGELPRVDIVYGHVGTRPDIVDGMVAAGARGIVLAGVGNGNVRKAVLDALISAVSRGVVVVRSTRVGSGAVGRNMEIDDDTFGFVAAETLNPQKARILLALGLTLTRDGGEIQEFFHTY
jgi:L-asparaginase